MAIRPLFPQPISRRYPPNAAAAAPVAASSTTPADRERVARMERQFVIGGLGVPVSGRRFPGQNRRTVVQPVRRITDTTASKS
jgi:hypothetical protein